MQQSAHNTMLSQTNLSKYWLKNMQHLLNHHLLTGMRGELWFKN